eukprot:3380243-Prymnesium_polylepis.1
MATFPVCLDEDGPPNVRIAISKLEEYGCVLWRSFAHSIVLFKRERGAEEHVDKEFSRSLRACHVVQIWGADAYDYDYD